MGSQGLPSYHISARRERGPVSSRVSYTLRPRSFGSWKPALISAPLNVVGGARYATVCVLLRSWTGVLCSVLLARLFSVGGLFRISVCWSYFCLFLAAFTEVYFVKLRRRIIFVIDGVQIFFCTHSIEDVRLFFVTLFLEVARYLFTSTYKLVEKEMTLNI